ncbi:hypothetical protein ACFLXE_05265 [Chloroflexota bacterium]
MIWDINSALKALYGDAVQDLTRDGYQEALRKLRKRNPTLARQAERILAPYLEEQVFLRKQKEWSATSAGTRARLALLPENPHVEEDTLAIRTALGIPDGHVNVEDNDILWKQVQDHVRPEAVRRVSEGNVASHWLHVHRQEMVGQSEQREQDDILPSAMWQSAASSAKVKLASANIPKWLQRPPSGPAPYNQSASPIDWATGRLIERHNLPWTAAPPLTFYVLTLDKGRISGLKSMQVNITYDDKTVGDLEAFTISVHGIDEFLMKDEWDHIWTDYVKPRQERLLERRGMEPQGRRTVNIDRLKQAMPIYHEMIIKNITFTDLLKLDKPLPGYKILRKDQEAIRRVINDLRKLLKPGP